MNSSGEQDIDKLLMEGDVDYNFDLQQAFDLLSENDDFAFGQTQAQTENSDKEDDFSSKFISKNSEGLINRANSNEFNSFSSYMSTDLERKDSNPRSNNSSANNMGILHWAGKIDSEAMTSSLATASTESPQTELDNSMTRKRSFSDIDENVGSHQPSQSVQDAFNMSKDGNSSNSDNDGDNDEEVENTSEKPKKGASSRPNVREHSKAQREKRKGNITGLEQQARELTVDLNNMNCQFIASLESCRARRHQQHRMAEAFLKLWINDVNAKSEGGTDFNHHPSGNIIGYEARKAKWCALFSNTENPDIYQGNSPRSRTALSSTSSSTAPLDLPIQMILPSTFSRFSPPMSLRSYPQIESSTKNSSEKRVHVSFSPEQNFGSGTKTSRYMQSLSDIIADSTCIAVMCQNISEFGPVQICHFMLGIDVPLDGFISEDLIAVAPFYLYSKNATMCGGNFEIDIKGYFRCEFSERGLITKIELNYDDFHLTEQLLESFGPSIYRPYSDVSFGDEMFHKIEFRNAQDVSVNQPELSVKDISISMARILHMDDSKDNHVFPRVNNQHVHPKHVRKNTHMDECRIMTSFDTNCIVEAINQTALEQFGAITGRSLISADWMTEALALLSQWSPYVCSLNTIRTSPETGGPTTETKCLLFPMFDKSAYESSDQDGSNMEQNESKMSISSSNPPCVPNKICWVIFNHHGNSHEKQLETIIQQFLHGAVTKFAAKLNYIGSSCYFLSFMTLLSQAELILQCDSDEDEDEDDCSDDAYPSPSPQAQSSRGTVGSSITEDTREKDLQDFLSMLEEFLKWLTALETKIWSEENPLLEIFFFNEPASSDYNGPPTRLSRMSLMELEKSAQETVPNDPFSLSKGLAPNSQALTSSFSSIIDSNSSVSSHSSSRSSSISDAEEMALHGDDREWTLFMEFLDDINNFFTMLRESHVTTHIVSLLKTISTTKQYLLLEELSAHCLTKHTNGRICFLMKQAKDLIQHQEFERAVEALTEVRSDLI